MKEEKVIRIEIHKLRKMFLLIPTIGMDIEYRCVFIVWLNRAIYLGKGKEEQGYGLRKNFTKRP